MKSHDPTSRSRLGRSGVELPGKATSWLGASAPGWASALTIGVTMFGVISAAPGPEHTFLLAFAVGVFAALLCRGQACVGDLLLALITAAAVGAAGANALALDAADFASSFVAQDPGQRPLLALRVAVVLLAMVGVRRHKDRDATLACVAALFVLSLVCRGALVVDVVVAGLLIRRQRDRETCHVPVWLMAALLGIPALALVRAPKGSAPSSPAGSPAEMIAAWRERRNLFRAHAVALDWARKEATPGDGYLALAEVDHELGQDHKAQKTLAKIVANPASEAVRRAAVDHAREWQVP